MYQSLLMHTGVTETLTIRQGDLTKPKTKNKTEIIALAPWHTKENKKKEQFKRDGTGILLAINESFSFLHLPIPFPPPIFISCKSYLDLSYLFLAAHMHYRFPVRLF